PAFVSSGRSRLLLAAAAVLSLALVAGLVRVVVAPGTGDPIRIGAVFPTTGNAASLAGPELAGVRIAAQLVNADGGIGGRPIELVERTLESRDDAPAIMAGLARQGIRVVVGAYSSDLSIAASAAADQAGLVYWEAGAVADRLTGRGLPLVFRVGTSGSTLGSNSARFTATELAPRLGKAAGQLRVAIAVADDEYARSVADAAVTTARQAGLDVVTRVSYNLVLPNWPDVMARLKAARPDTIILASHIPDGIAFRQAMLASGLRVGALIGSTMAECDPDFAGDLGADAIGIFASDRPTAGFRPEALDAAARAAYDRFSTAWGDASASFLPPASSAAGADGSPAAEEYGLSGPAESPTAEQDEEALAGFSAGWALFHHVLPGAAAAGGGLEPAAVASAARALDLPEGALPNGAGLRFSSDPATLGQNERAAAVIWQWQAVRQYAFVWPPAYATGVIRDVPLNR
ncbi:MAG TPA: ABC transporter substrate-binding protein, partial [Candidatus Acidoferrales bacterium]|nr:ABC transporter substrate-binding protein [Candidatus Acidoferrales bacterium]